MKTNRTFQTILEIQASKQEPNTVSWKIVKRTGGFQQASMKCNLCLNEKLEIATKFGDIMNSKSELISKCRHVNKHTLALFDSKD